MFFYKNKFKYLISSWKFITLSSHQKPASLKKYNEKKLLHYTGEGDKFANNDAYFHSNLFLPHWISCIGKSNKSYEKIIFNPTSLYMLSSVVLLISYGIMFHDLVLSPKSLLGDICAGKIVKYWKKNYKNVYFLEKYP